MYVNEEMDNGFLQDPNRVRKEATYKGVGCSGRFPEGGLHITMGSIDPGALVMKYLNTITAASVLAFSAFASAETSLSQNEMDGVNAGGFAIADAIADAFGEVTSAYTNTFANVVSTNLFLGQLGAIFVIDSDALAEASSDSDGQAQALASGYGVTQGTLMSDTESYAATVTDTSVAFPYSASMAYNTSLASTIIIGDTASANSSASSLAALHN
jgi:hypothetical protein